MRVRCSLLAFACVVTPAALVAQGNPGSNAVRELAREKSKKRRQG